MTFRILSDIVCRVMELKEEKINVVVEQTMLYDFYGELLTEHQKEIYEDVVLQDYSISEVAEDKGISRQGVHDLIRRCDRILAGYEEKLHLVEKFRHAKQEVSRIEQLAKESGTQPDEEIARIARELLDTF